MLRVFEISKIYHLQIFKQEKCLKIVLRLIKIQLLLIITAKVKLRQKEPLIAFMPLVIS